MRVHRDAVRKIGVIRHDFWGVSKTKERRGRGEGRGRGRRRGGNENKLWIEERKEEATTDPLMMREEAGLEVK